MAYRGTSALALAGIPDEPAAIETLGVIFVGAREMPVAVPDLDPGVVAALIGPHGRCRRRAGMPTARQASTRMMERPVQVALPMATDSLGLWLGRLRPVL
jgi:hypothetical protein